MSAITTFSQALPILATHGLTPVPAGGKLWAVGAMRYDKGGIILLARKYEAQEGNAVTNQAYTFDQAASALRSLGYSVRPHGARYLVAYGDSPATPMRESELIALASGLSSAESPAGWTATCGSCGQQFIADSPVADGAICPACAPSQALTTTNGVLVGVAMMEAVEARSVITRIKERIELARRDLLDLHDREGWKALGYSSWGACAKAEFGGSAATLYRQLEAAEIERDVVGDSQLENPPIPTAQLQAVKALAPEQRAEAFKRADEIAGDTPRTAAHVAQAAQEIARPARLMCPTCGEPILNGVWGDLNECGSCYHARQRQPAAPDLSDILKRLDAHGYAKSGTRQKGMTTFYSFRDYSGRSDESGGEIELAEGELSLWLSELDANAAYAQAKQEKYLDARDRAARLGWRLERDGAQFTLYQPDRAEKVTTGPLDRLLATLANLERDAAKAATVPTLADLDSALPKALEAAGYFWHYAQSLHFVIAHNDGWRGDARTVAQALQLATDRETAKAIPFDVGAVARLAYKLGATTDREAAMQTWLHIGKLLEPKDSQQIVSSWAADEVAAFASEADDALSTLDIYGHATIAAFVRQTYTLLLDKEPPPIGLTPPNPAARPVVIDPNITDARDVLTSPLDPILRDVTAIQAWADEAQFDSTPDEIYAKLAELAALRKRLDLLSDAPDVNDYDYEELSGLLGELEAELKGWLESAATV